jgi:hypothetical protein
MGFGRDVRHRNRTSLLVQTRQLTTEDKVGKRAEDTGVFIGEFIVGSVDSERGLRALSKMNWLHRRYGSKIGNEELTHLSNVCPRTNAMD